MLIANRDKRRLRKQLRAKVQPHRSFRLTSRRDYLRTLKMPGYIAFTHEVSLTLWKNKRLFGSLALLYALLVIVAGGVSSQENYVQLHDLVISTTKEVSVLGQGANAVAGAAAILFTSVSGNGSLNDAQQIYLVLAVLLVWLTSVWILRELLASRRPKLRDALYNASSPILSTILVGFVLLLQLLPFAVTATVYAALLNIGFASQGLGAMLSVLILILIGALTLYWLTSTFIALVVVTLPGMYPMKAIHAASDLVVSRRLRVMYRLVWMLAIAVVTWIVIMIPLIIFEGWLRERNEWLSAIPTIPFLITAMSALTTIWITAYIYLMYRKLVEDGSIPG